MMGNFSALREVLMKDLDADPAMNAVEALGLVTARRRDTALASLVMIGFYLEYRDEVEGESCNPF